MLEAVREIWFGEGTTYIKICYGNVYVDGEAGQLGDRGEVDTFRIKSVKRIENEIVLEIDGKIEKHKGELVDIRIDEERRIDISQQHTAQHLLSAVFLSEMDAETVGFQMGEEYTTIDLSLGILQDDMIDYVERLCNDFVSEDRSVRRFFIDGSEIHKYNLRKEVKREIAESEREIRLVEIDGIDVSACSGLHVESTAQIGPLKILKHEKVKGSLARVYFVAGKRALNDYFTKHKLITNSSLLLTCSYLDLPDRIASLINEIKQGNSTIRSFSERLAGYVAKGINGSTSRVIFLEDKENVLLSIPRFVTLEEYLIIGKSGDRIYLFCKGYDCREVLSRIKKEFDVKGGSGKERGQFVFNDDFVLIKEIVENSY
ncbi:MAG: alanyl-tRNA editing protein [Kosmotogaceae bacterium]|nr:alanyl-tRNA editing protein [Kosmotogaceae bacterium]